MPEAFYMLQAQYRCFSSCHSQIEETSVILLIGWLACSVPRIELLFGNPRYNSRVCKPHVVAPPFFF